MKRISCFILTLILATSVCFTAYAEASNCKFDISVDNNAVSDNKPTGYGINLDGLSSSNLIENGSFENDDKGWKFGAPEYTYGTSNPMNENNPTYNVITVDKSYVLENNCYGGISFVKDGSYEFSFYVRNVDFEGTISVYLNGDKNKNEINQLSTAGISNNSWTKSTTEITAVSDEVGNFAISFEGEGTIEIDFVSLVEKDSYGYDNPNWKGYGIRQNMFSALKNAKPAFLSFSVSEPSWKNTIGSPYEREKSELGYHEFLQLSKDLNAIAIPSIYANKYSSDSDQFTNYKQDILDLIEYANANWATSFFGSQRASNGSQEPFNLKYVQLVGEGKQLDEIKKAIENKYSNITVLSESDIAVIENEKNDLGATLDNAISSINSNSFVMYGNTFEDFIKLSSNDVSYSANYFAQMLLSNNQGSRLLDYSLNSSIVDCQSAVTIDQSKNAIFVSIVNKGSAFDSVIRTDKLDGVTSASIQYVSDGYLSAYNDFGKQYIAPSEKQLEVNDGYIEAKIPQNSVSVVRITFNNANSDVLFSLPETINLKSKNYVPPVIIAVIIALAVAIPVGSICGFVLYKKVISRKSKEDINE